MSLDLFYSKDGRNYEFLKRDLATGALFPMTEEDVEELLAQEDERRRQEVLRLKVQETARKLGEGDYGP